MTEIELLSTLVGEIYDAALDATLWRPTLAKAARFVGGQVATLFSKNASSLTGANAYDSGLAAHYTRLYFDEYIKIDPLVFGHVLADVEQPVATSDLMAYDEFVQSRFFTEWVRPQGLVDFVSAVLDKSFASAALFGVFRDKSDGLTDDATRERMRLIVPHLRRATAISGVVSARTGEAADLAESLDGLSAGVFLLDTNGIIRHANAAGQAMLDAGDILKMVNGQLRASDAGADRQLGEAIATTIRGGATPGAKAAGLALAAGDGTRYVAHALPFGSATRQSSAIPLASLAFFVSKTAIDPPSLPEAIGRAYKLTATELRVLLAIVDAGGAPEVADALGVAASTVKTHLARLYEKTGARRQADLVKIVAGFSTPLR